MVNAVMVPPQLSQPVDNGSDHWLVVPLFGETTEASALFNRLGRLLESGFGVVLVDNNPIRVEVPSQPPLIIGAHRYRWIVNGNLGGIAGGFNRGIASAIAAGATTITLLDQDSSLDEGSLRWLREPFDRYPHDHLLVGPRIWDQRRASWHQPAKRCWHGFPRTRLLISSGTTFVAEQWPLLGPFEESLFIDFVDHAWCFRAQAVGFVLLQHPKARLEQQFGHPHPHRFCCWLGLELYSPQRHYYSIRNLRWLLRQRWVPLDLRFKEAFKMLLKPWLWLLFEPQRHANVRAILGAFRAPLPQAGRMNRGPALRHGEGR